MATKYWSSTKQNCTTYTDTVDALYRVWVADLHESLLGIGLVVDTVSSGAHMGVISAAICPDSEVWTNFFVYELNDSFSATLPIYIKIAYGGIRIHTANTKAAIPLCSVTIGTTVDAAGVIGGMTLESFQTLYYGTSGTSIAAYYGPNILSKSDGFLFFAASGALVHGIHTTGCVSFVIERVPDENGNMTADGFTVVRPIPSATRGAAAARTALCRTITATHDLASWQVNPCVCNGGAAAASADGGINLFTFYHHMHDLRPMRGLLGYYGPALTKGSRLGFPTPDGGSGQYRMLGGGVANEYYFLTDALDPNFAVACLWE